MRGIWRAAFLTAALAVTPVQAEAADEIINGVSGADFAAILTEIGWSVELTEREGQPLIVARYTDPNSGTAYDFHVGLYRCAKETGLCYDVMFMRSTEASKPVTLMMVNKYNSTQMFGVAYLNDDGTLGQSMTQTIQGGVTRQNIKEMADWWQTIITGFDAKVTNR